MLLSSVGVHQNTSWQDNFTIRGSCKVGETNKFVVEANRRSEIHGAPTSFLKLTDVQMGRYSYLIMIPQRLCARGHYNLKGKSFVFAWPCIL